MFWILAQGSEWIGNTQSYYAQRNTGTKLIHTILIFDISKQKLTGKPEMFQLNYDYPQ